jgi:hypothetical protein
MDGTIYLHRARLLFVSQDGGWRVPGSGRAVTGDEAARLVQESVKSGQLEVWFEHGKEKSLSLITNGRRAMVVLWGRLGYDEGVFAVDAAAGDAEHGGYVLQNGQHDSYPDNQTVPLDSAIEAVRYIVDHGDPDPRRRWQAW